MIESQVTNLLTEAEAALRAALAPGGGPSPAVRPFPWKNLDDGKSAGAPTDQLASKGESLELRIELGRTRMHRDEASKLRAGAVIPLDEPIGEPVNVYAGGRLVARGEMLVVDERLAVRVVEVVAA
jgi:flagellar motor switch protein FliN